MNNSDWITPLYAGLLGILLLVLSYGVSRERMKRKVTIGDGEFPTLHRAIRAHGNLIEYAPFALILMLLVELEGFSDGIVHGLGITLVAGRVLHGIGLSLNSGPSAPRAIGTTLTWLMILIASALAIFGAILPDRF